MEVHGDIHRDTQGYTGIHLGHGDTRDTWGHGDTLGYTWVHGDTRGYMGTHGDTQQEKGNDKHEITHEENEGIHGRGSEGYEVSIA